MSRGVSATVFCVMGSARSLSTTRHRRICRSALSRNRRNRHPNPHQSLIQLEHQQMAKKRKKQTTTRPSKRALTASQIFNASKNARLRVPVPEWGGHVFVRAVRQCDFNDLLTALGGSDLSMDEKFSRFVILVTCDENGDRIFKDSQYKDVIELGLPPMMRVMRLGMKFNNLSTHDVDELVGKSPTTPGSSSG